MLANKAKHREMHHVFCVCVTLAVWADQADDKSGTLKDRSIAVPASQTHPAAAASEHIDTQHTVYTGGNAV